MNIVPLIVILLTSISLPDSLESQQIGFQDPVTPIMQGILDLQHDRFLFMLIIPAFIVYLIRRAYYLYYQNITFISATFLYKSVSFWVLWPYFICLLVSLIPFESFAMENINHFRLEEDSAFPQNEQNEEVGPINGPPSQALPVFTGAQNQQDAPTSSNQALIIPQRSFQYNLYNNPDGYVDAPQGNIHASVYVPGNIKIGEQYMLSGQALADKGHYYGGVLHYKHLFNRFELADQGLKIDLASSVDPGLANELRLELLNIKQRQQTDLAPYIEKARDSAIRLNPAESIQAQSTLTLVRSAVAETWNDPRFQAALSVAQGPLSALDVVGFKCAVDHYSTNNR